MSEVLIATVGVDVCGVMHDSLAQLKKMDLSMANVIDKFNPRELMEDQVHKVLDDLDSGGKYILCEGFDVFNNGQGGTWTSDRSGNKIIAVIKSDKLSDGVGVSISKEGKVNFVEHRYDYRDAARPRNDKAAEEHLKAEIKAKLLSGALMAMLQATGWKLADFNLETDKETGEFVAAEIVEVK